MASLASATSAGGLFGWSRYWRWWPMDEVVTIDSGDTDWALASASNPTLADDTNDASVAAMVLDSTVETGFGLRCIVPGDTEAVRVTVQVRSETGVAGDVVLQVYGRTIGTTSTAWSSAVALDTTTVANTEARVNVQTILDISDLNLVAGSPCLLEVTRDPTDVADTLADTLAVSGVGIEWL